VVKLGVQIFSGKDLFMKMLYPYLCRPENGTKGMFLRVWIGSSVGYLA